MIKKVFKKLKSLVEKYRNKLTLSGKAQIFIVHQKFINVKQSKKR